MSLATIPARTYTDPVTLLDPETCPCCGHPWSFANGCECKLPGEEAGGVFLSYGGSHTAARLYPVIPFHPEAPAPPEQPGTFTHYPKHTLPEPRTISAARAQALTWERALGLLESGYSFQPSECYDTFLVFKPGTLCASYEVCPHTWKCSCPSFQGSGNYCKHTLAVSCWVRTCARFSEAQYLCLSSEPARNKSANKLVALLVRDTAKRLQRAA
jgi:hypothetical protein